MEKTKSVVSYKQQPVKDNYDVIVIGSGMGGLAVGAIMAKEGKKVLILERHYTPGGFTHVFKRKDYEWDVGLHYIGEVHEEGTLLKVFFDYVTDGQLKWADMGEVYDRIIFGEKEYPFVKGTRNFIEKMKEHFPDPADQYAIDDYVDLVFKTAKSAKGFFGSKGLPTSISWLISPFMRRTYLKYATQSTLDVMKSITSNKELIGVLTGQYGDYGLPPADSSFGMHAMVVKHYFKGGSYPVGGSERIAETTGAVIAKSGGTIFTNAEVAEVIVKEGKALGVRMADGKEIFADCIISDAGAENTYSKLLDEQTTKELGIENLLNSVRHSVSHISLYIGLKHTAAELGLGKANLWIYPDNYDHDENVRNFLSDPSAPLPVTYISFPSAKDPDFLNRYPGKATIEIITLAPFEWFEKWEDKRWKKRGEDYENFKENLAQRLLEQLYKYVPTTKGKVDYYELSSPLSTKHFVNYTHGEIYGLDHTPERFEQKFLQPRTPVKNLFLTGQDIATAGVGGALYGGLISASVAMKKDLFRKILKESSVER